MELFKHIQVLVLACLIPVIAKADPPENYGFVDFNSGLKQAQKTGKKMFIYLGRYGCGYCDKTNKESFSDPGIKKRYMENYVLVYIDAESGDRIQLASGESITEQQFGAKLKALVTPYFIFMEPGGKLIFKAPGFKTVEDLRLFDEYINSNTYRKMSLKDFAAQGG